MYISVWYVFLNNMINPGKNIFKNLSCIFHFFLKLSLITYVYPPKKGEEEHIMKE